MSCICYVERKQQNGSSDLTATIVMVDGLDASVVGEEKVVVDPIDRGDQTWLASPSAKNAGRGKSARKA